MGTHIGAAFSFQERPTVATKKSKRADNIFDLSQYRRFIEPVSVEHVFERTAITPEGDEAETQPPREPLRVWVRSNVSFAELNAIPRGMSATFEECFPRIAHMVTKWNLQAENLETGEVEDVPPPAVAGPDVFLLLEPVEATWLIVTCRTAHLGGDDRKKGSTAPASTDEPSDAESTDKAA